MNHTRRVKDVMNPDIMTVADDMTTDELVRYLTEREISGAPVVDSQGHLIGVVSMTDIGRHLSEPSDFAPHQRPEFYRDTADDVTFERVVHVQSVEGSVSSPRRDGEMCGHPGSTGAQYMNFPLLPDRRNGKSQSCTAKFARTGSRRFPRRRRGMKISTTHTPVFVPVAHRIPRGTSATTSSR